MSVGEFVGVCVLLPVIDLSFTWQCLLSTYRDQEDRENPLLAGQERKRKSEYIFYLCQDFHKANNETFYMLIL